MAWYDTGTVNVTNGSTTVVGVGTNFIAGAQVGEGFYGPDGGLYEIQAIVSATSLTLADAYLGSNQTGQAYKIVPTQSLVAALATQVSTLISDFQGVVDEAGSGKFNDGTAASAGITFTLDQDTGIFRPAANQIGFTTAGIERVKISSAGVDVTGNLTVSSTLPVITISETDTGNSHRVLSDAGNLYIQAQDSDGTNDGDMYLTGYFNNNLNLLNIKAVTTAITGGNVGIGTASPSAALDVVGSAEVNGDALIISGNATPLHVDRSTSSGAATIQVSNSTHTTYFGTRSGGGFAIDDDADLGSAPWFVIDTAGQVGIATTSPSAALDVVGTTELNGNTTVDGFLTVQGSTGSIFLTDTDVSVTSRIWQTSESLYIDNQSILGGGTYLRTDNGKIRQIIRGNGDISFRNTAGTADGLLWDASAESLGIGTTSPSEKLEVAGNIILDATDANIKIKSGATGTAGAVNFTFNTDSTSYGSLSLPYDTRVTVGLLAQTNNSYPVSISSGTVNSSTNAIILSTSGTEAMRIDNLGSVLVGKTSANFATAGIQLRPAEGSSFTQDGVQPLSLNRLTSDGSILKLFKTGVEVGSISVTGSATAYNTSSDYRLKENITPVQGAADIVKAMQPVTYTFKSDGSWHDGFLAHELQELHPRAVTGEKDAMRDEEYEVTPAVYEDVIIPAVEAVAEVPAVYDDEGVLVSEMVPAVEAQPEHIEQRLVSEAVMGTRSVPDYQGVDYSKLTPILTAALQEALNKIDTLEARLAALEGA